MSEDRLPRPEQRRRTEQRIVACARDLFADRGFERTTIRAVARSAGVDPALVMQYFGSKQGLFSAAIRASPDPVFAGEPGQLAGFLLDILRGKLNDSGQERMAMLRSMLTHPAAAEHARENLGRQGQQLAAMLPTADAQLRAALIFSLMLGIRIGRDLLKLDPLAGAAAGQVLDLMHPVFEALASDTGSR
jgi:AcrR family transcriptional regulator